MDENKEETLVPTPNTNQDDLILKQQREIELEIQNKNPFVSDLGPLSKLVDEYNDDMVYSSKVKHLATKYKSIRRTRPDGNCFFRGFAYSYLEYLINHKDEFSKFSEYIINSKNDLVQLGFPSFTIEDFYDTFVEVLSRISPIENTMEVADKVLQGLLNDQGYSDYIVVYLRLITSGEIQKNCEFYQNFIDGDRTVAEFRKQEVEPMYKESDHIHIIALSNAVNAGVRVEYMDRGDGSSIKAHDFPEGGNINVYLLYRPGHYDILYPN